MNAQRKRDSGQSAENTGRNVIPDKVQKIPEETRFRTRCRKCWKRRNSGQGEGNAGRDAILDKMQKTLEERHGRKRENKD